VDKLEVKEKLITLLKKDKPQKIIVILGLCGILLISLPSMLSSNKEEKTESEIQENNVVSSEEYANALETKLSQIIGAITGEKEVEVMLTLKSDSRLVYAVDEERKSADFEKYEGGEIKESENNHDMASSYIIIKDSNGNQQALKVTEIQPEIKGVVVVSSKAEDGVTEEKIINAVKTVLGISSSKVCVIMQGVS